MTLKWGDCTVHPVICIHTVRQSVVSVNVWARLIILPCGRLFYMYASRVRMTSQAVII